MELKHQREIENQRIADRFNRTIMELKHNNTVATLKGVFRFNRTIMELKLAKKFGNDTAFYLL